MRKLLFAPVLVFILSACSKNEVCPPDKAMNEAPVIKLIAPQNTQTVQAGDVLTVKAIYSDPDLISVASWEAVNAARFTGSSPYSGQFHPMTRDYEMNVSFKIPAHYEGERIIRLYAVDATGKITTLDVKYLATN